MAGLQIKKKKYKYMAVSIAPLIQTIVIHLQKKIQVGISRNVMA